ncbi:MAG: DUF6576 domain-containing protein [Bacteroidia bacterium]
MQEKLRYELNKFLRVHDALGWFIVMIGVSLVAQLILYLALTLVLEDGSAVFYKVLSYVAMPASLQEGITRPWSIFTWPFVSLDPHFHFGGEGEPQRGLGIVNFLVSGYIMFVFGRIGQQLLGSVRLRRFILLSIPVVGLAVMTIGTFVFTGAEGARPLTYLSGMMPLVIALISVTAALVPDYPVPMMLFGKVKLKWLALAFIILEFFLVGLAVSPFAWAIILSASFAIAYVYLMREGTDLVEVVSSWFRKKEQAGAPKRAPEKGKVRSMKMRPQSNQKQTASVPKDGPVPQEEVDRILDKINEEGYESLTRDEKERLLRASDGKDVQ